MKRLLLVLGIVLCSTLVLAQLHVNSSKVSSLSRVKYAVNASPATTLCITPPPGQWTIARPGTYRLCPGVHNHPDPILINADNVVLDCAGATLWGDNNLVGYMNGSVNWTQMQAWWAIEVAQNRGYVSIMNCNIWGFMEGIRLAPGTHHVKIHSNKIWDVGSGINAWPTHDAHIFDNELHDVFFAGITFFGSIPGFGPPERNEVFDNYLHDFMRTYWATPLEGPPFLVCPGIGLQMQGDARLNEVYDNVFERICQIGIMLSGDPWASKFVNRNDIRDNVLEDTFLRGIYLRFAQNNNVKYNDVQQSHWQSVVLENSTNNAVIYNNIEVTQSGQDPWDEDGHNVWDDGAGGNYYVDPANPCVDVNNDDVCDDPYVIPGSSASVDNLRSEFPI